MLVRFFKYWGMLDPLSLVHRCMLGIEPMTAALLASAGTSLIGGILGGSSAASAQRKANEQNAALAKQQSQDAYNNWLASRGINPGTRGVADYAGYLAAHPEYQAEYNRVKAAGDRRSFDQWFEDHLNLNPTERQKIASFGGSGAINTTLPLWATTGGMPTEQFLLNRILQTSGIDYNPDDWLSEDNVSAYLASSPDTRADLEAMLAQNGDKRTPEQWLYDDLKAGDTNSSFISGVKAAHAANAPTTGAPAQYQNLQDAAVASAGRIFDGGYLSDELNALAPALAARRAAADLGFDRNDEMRSRVGDIYDAELLAADTYGNSAMDAVSRVLAENRAKRALQGFSGGSSFDDLTRARTLAPALNAGALARATAGVNKAKSLSGILDTDVQIGQQNADLQNAIDRLQLISGDIGRRIGASSLPAQLYSNKVQMDNLASDARFTDIDATLKRLGMFTSNNSTPPTPTYAQAQPSITGGQIAGQALSTLGQMGMNYWSTQSLLNGLKNTGGSTYKGIPVANTPDTASTGKWW